jgi:hypothetical protein
VIALPGLYRPGSSRLAPIALLDVARCVVRIASHPKALRRVIELAGPQTLSYAALLRHLRKVQGGGWALWLPLPWWLMKLAAWMVEGLPQKVVSVDNLRLLQAGSVSKCSETARWLGREALTVAHMNLLTGAGPASAPSSAGASSALSSQTHRS